MRYRGRDGQRDLAADLATRNVIFVADSGDGVLDAANFDLLGNDDVVGAIRPAYRVFDDARFLGSGVDAVLQASDGRLLRCAQARLRRYLLRGGGLIDLGALSGLRCIAFRVSPLRSKRGCRAEARAQRKRDEALQNLLTRWLFRWLFHGHPFLYGASASPLETSEKPPRESADKAFGNHRFLIARPTRNRRQTPAARSRERCWADPRRMTRPTARPMRRIARPPSRFQVSPVPDFASECDKPPDPCPSFRLAPSPVSQPGIARSPSPCPSFITEPQESGVSSRRPQSPIFN